MYQTKTSQTHKQPTQTLLIKESPPEPTINHDLLCKKLLELYFEPFLEAFYPQLHEKLDFTHQKLLSEEFIADRSEEHTSELQSRGQLLCRLLLDKKKTQQK